MNFKYPAADGCFKIHIYIEYGSESYIGSKQAYVKLQLQLKFSLSHSTHK